MRGELHPFLSGGFVMAAIAVAFFYLRYFRRTHDRLFAVLAVAFAMLAVERGVLAFFHPMYEGRHIVFLVRLAAFLAIIIGVADKNWPRAWRLRREVREAS